MRHPSGGFAGVAISPERLQLELPQGGHGQGATSLEELRRPGKNYVVSKTGLTYHGARYAPEETPRGGTHVNVRPDGSYLVNEGSGLTSAQEKMLSKAVGKPVFRIYDFGGLV